MHTSLLFTLLLLGVFLAALWAGTRVLIGLLSWVFRGFRPRRSWARRGVTGTICPNKQCCQPNLAEANFCAQCGTSLRVTYSSGEW